MERGRSFGSAARHHSSRSGEAVALHRQGHCQPPVESVSAKDVRPGQAGRMIVNGHASRRRHRKEVDSGRSEPRAPAGGSPGRAAVESGDDDLADVRDILKKHGIS